MSDEKVNLEWLGNRVMTMTAEIRDMQHRISALEHRFTSLESRVTALEMTMVTRLDMIERRAGGIEERMSAMLSLLVRIAERVAPADPQSNPPSSTSAD
jgi:TolA-binding protein